MLKPRKRRRDHTEDNGALCNLVLAAAVESNGHGHYQQVLKTEDDLTGNTTPLLLAQKEEVRHQQLSSTVLPVFETAPPPDNGPSMMLYSQPHNPQVATTTSQYQSMNGGTYYNFPASDTYPNNRAVGVYTNDGELQYSQSFSDDVNNGGLQQHSLSSAAEHLHQQPQHNMQLISEPDRKKLLDTSFDDSSSITSGTTDHQQQQLNQSQQQASQQKQQLASSSDQQSGGDCSPVPDTPPLQCIRFEPFQPHLWHTLCDHQLQDMVTPHYRIDADKGFNFSVSDDAFVCQKKNHFQVTCHVQLINLVGLQQQQQTANGETMSCNAVAPHETPQQQPFNAIFVQTQNGLEKVRNFCLHFYGVKFEAPRHMIRVEQSQSDRSKKPFHPVM